MEVVIFILLVVMIAAHSGMTLSQGDEIATSAARAAGDSTRHTVLPSGCSGLFFVLMLLAGGLAMAALLTVGSVQP